MLNIASSPSFAWTPATSAAQPSSAAPVGAVTPVRSVQPDQRSTGDARTGNGPTRDRPATAAVAERAHPRDAGEQAARAETYLPEPAPLLPRQKPQDGQGQSQQEAADEQSGGAGSDSARESTASTVSTYPLPQEMVSSVWLASAAVVNPVLEAQLEARSSLANDTAPDLSVVAATQVARAAIANKASAAATPLQAQIPLPFSSGDPLAAKAESVGAQSVAGDGSPAAYDERGNAARPLPESGSLLSERA